LKKKSDISDRVVAFILTRDIDEFETLDVNSVAREFGINRSYLSQKFRMDMGSSLSDYILLVKILRSTTILERSKRITVGEIAVMMGFNSANYFNRIFKKVLGTTPGRYRNYAEKLKKLKMLDKEGFERKLAEAEYDSMS
jgi:AraC-like DNA-binding protein